MNFSLKNIYEFLKTALINILIAAFASLIVGLVSELICIFLFELGVLNTISMLASHVWELATDLVSFVPVVGYFPSLFVGGFVGLLALSRVLGLIVEFQEDNPLKGFKLPDAKTFLENYAYPALYGVVGPAVYIGTFWYTADVVFAVGVTFLTSFVSITAIAAATVYFQQQAMQQPPPGTNPVLTPPNPSQLSHNLSNSSALAQDNHIAGKALEKDIQTPEDNTSRSNFVDSSNKGFLTAYNSMGLQPSGSCKNSLENELPSNRLTTNKKF